MNADRRFINPRCTCCPYGVHLALDFDRYCEALLSPFYMPHEDVAEKNVLKASLERSQFPASGKSLPVGETFPWFCDHENENCKRVPPNEQLHWTTSNSTNPTSLRPPWSDDLLHSSSYDSSFNDAIVKFEEVLRELQQAWRCKHGIQREQLSIKTELPDSLRSESPPVSPAASVDSSAQSGVNKVVLSQIRDQMALSLQRMKELEHQTREVPILKQKLILAREQNKRLLEKLNNEYNEESFSTARLKELERTGMITPPLLRRKSLFRSDSDGEEDELELFSFKGFGETKSMVSSKNIDLQNLDGKRDVYLQTSRSIYDLRSTGTSSDFLRDVFWRDASTNTSLTSGKLTKLSAVTTNSVSIQPDTASVIKKSVGVSTNFAPSLPRKNMAVVTDLRSKELVSVRELSESKPIVKCMGTDPIMTSQTDAGVQAVAKQKTKSTKMDSVTLVDVGTCYDAKHCLDYKEYQKSSQTDRCRYEDKMVQALGKCVYCELKQTETVGVGEGCVWINDASVITDHLPKLTLPTNSNESVKLCEKCSEAAKIAKLVVKDKTPSPTTGSKIPRLTHSVSLDSGQNDSQKRIIIEEGTNEILVYRNPNIPQPGKHRSHFPNMITGQQQVLGLRLLDEVCKISESESDSNSSDEGTYDLDTSTISPSSPRKRVEPSRELRAALKVLNDSLVKPERGSKPATTKSLQITEKEWFKIAAQRDSVYSTVEDYLDCFETYSKHLLNCVVNLTDSNGNTAMHYAISHSNFDIVAVLLESKVCDVNKQNKAGYTCVMLVSLARITNETQKEVIRRLFQLGDVNIRAKQNGQTALMLASSHGQFITCKLLLEAGAALNVQDNDGSTALMCAAEHGHADVVRLLLSHPECDPNIVDNDHATALSVAMENGHKDIGLMLYASTNMLSRGSSPYASLRRSQSKAAATSLKRTGSFTSRTQTTNKSYQLAPSPPPPAPRSRHSSAASGNGQTTKTQFY